MVISHFLSFSSYLRSAISEHEQLATACYYIEFDSVKLLLHIVYLPSFLPFRMHKTHTHIPLTHQTHTHTQHTHTHNTHALTHTCHTHTPTHAIHTHTHTSGLQCQLLSQLCRCKETWLCFPLLEYWCLHI